mgnify:FL=1
MLDYLVVYDSETGNTKKIATEIFASLPGMSKDLINLHERTDFPEAKIYFVGFCVHRGTSRLATSFPVCRTNPLLSLEPAVPETARNTTKRSHPASGSGLKMTITISVLLSARGKCRLLSVKNMNPC